MVVITIDGAYVAYDATSDVEIVTTVNGADAAWQEAAVAFAIPVMGTDDIHSSVFGGQVINGG